MVVCPTKRPIVTTVCTRLRAVTIAGSKPWTSGSGIITYDSVVGTNTITKGAYEMDTPLLPRILIGKSQSQILVDELSDEWRDGSQNNRQIKQDLDGKNFAPL